MTNFPLVKFVTAALVAVVLTTGVALAGSSAQTTGEITLRLGAGANYPATSQVIVEGTAVNVQRCSRNWCLVEASSKRGWTAIGDLTFGETAATEDTLTLGGSGQICFHTGTNFTGQKVCSTSGRVVPDLALHGYDNAFASISIEGQVSANVCRDSRFASYCEQINESQARLPRLLNRAISSYRVW